MMTILKKLILPWTKNTLNMACNLLSRLEHEVEPLRWGYASHGASSSGEPRHGTDSGF